MNNVPSSPERNLFLAVLTDALRFYTKYKKSLNPRALVICREIEEWVDYGEDHFFSFDNVCYISGFNEEVIRDFFHKVRDGKTNHKVEFCRPDRKRKGNTRRIRSVNEAKIA